MYHFDGGKAPIKNGKSRAIAFGFRRKMERGRPARRKTHEAGRMPALQ
jgi:hypothetical protein